jgi:hypothetical protein
VLKKIRKAALGEEGNEVEEKAAYFQKEKAAFFSELDCQIAAVNRCHRLPTCSRANFSATSSSNVAALASSSDLVSSSSAFLHIFHEDESHAILRCCALHIVHRVIRWLVFYA